MGKRENQFQRELIKEIKDRFPGSIVLKNDANYIQGIPDLLVLYETNWAALEVKKNATASHRPNQDYYIRRMDQMSYASFIYPENKEEVLNGMAEALQSGWSTRANVSESIGMA